MISPSPIATAPPTRWGVYGPATINRDPRWWAERGLNSLSILSYLAVADTSPAMPNTARWRGVGPTNGYGQKPDVPQGPVWPRFGKPFRRRDGGHVPRPCSDTPPIPRFRNQVRYAFFAYWANEAPELNPFFNFAFAPFGLGQSVTNVWASAR